MARKVADVLWEILVNAGVKRCYGIVGDALNPVIDALRRNANVDFVHVRNEEYGVFAARSGIADTVSRDGSSRHPFSEQKQRVLGRRPGRGV
jgi:hypothetical protein